MKRLIIVSLILAMISVNSLAVNWEKVEKRTVQVGTVLKVADGIHKQLDPERKAEEEKKKKEVIKKVQASNTELENKIAGVFMSSVTGQEPNSPDSYAVTYLHTLKQKYVSDYKSKYKTLVKNRETEAKFNQIYPHAVMQEIMSLPTKDEVKQAMDQRYPMLF